MNAQSKKKNTAKIEISQKPIYTCLILNSSKDNQQVNVDLMNMRCLMKNNLQITIGRNTPILMKEYH